MGKTGKKKMPEAGHTGMTAWQKIRDVISPFVIMILLLILADLVVLLTAGLVSQTYDPESVTEAVPSTSIISTIVFYVLTLIVLRRHFRFDSMRFGKDENVWSAGRNVMAVVTAVCWGNLVSCLIGIVGLENIFTQYETAYTSSFEGQNPILLILSVVVLGPVCEEYVFRGMIYRRARMYTGQRAGALISSLLFGIYHGNMIQLLYAFCLGLLLAAIYEKSRSLKLCVAAHAALNLWTIFLGYGLHIETMDPSTYPFILPLAEAAVAAAGLYFLFGKRAKSR